MTATAERVVRALGGPVLGTVALILFAPGIGARASLPRLGPAPNFALTSVGHDRVWLAELRGRVVVLAFGCTACRACPALWPALAGAADVRDGPEDRRLVLVVVSVDPGRDTPPTLRAFARDRALTRPGWLLLTGSRPEIDVVTRRYGVTVRREAGRVDVPCAATLVDRAGTVRGRYDGDTLGRLAPDVATALAEPALR